MSLAVGPDGKLIAFEAQPGLGEHLRAVKHRFRLDNMIVVTQGLLSRAGRLVMRWPEAGSGMASFHADAATNLDEIEVVVIALDDYLEKHNTARVSFVKCDVEGHELGAFRGAVQLLRRDKSVLLFECHDDEAGRGELFDYLAAIGYDGYFCYVSRVDHESWFHKGRGQFMPVDQRASYAHVHPEVKHRNFFFVANGTRP